MSLWRKDTGSEELIAIALIVLEKSEDYIEYKSYNYPFSHLKYGRQILGFNSQLKKWREEAKDIKFFRANYSYMSDEYDMNTEEGREKFYEFHIINKVNTHLQINLRWKDGQSAKQQFNRGKDIYYYFKKEESFQ
tara:strand:- start:1724 stop:2128 length:405 start_codon:yes stop_codon:yes gene_type:complete